MSVGVHPFIMIAAAGVLAALVAVIIACRAQRRWVTATMSVLALLLALPAVDVFLAFHPELVDGRFRVYRSFYRDIEVGMTREQVIATMNKHYPADGPRMRPKIMDDSPGRLGFFMNPETSREPNCEGIFLTLERGLVAKIDYSED